MDIVQKVFSRCKRDEETGCLEWQGACINKGYGHIRLNTAGVITWDGPHRIVWKHSHGEIPKGMMVCHHCDNRVCAEISHLFLGTAKANAADMIAKGRSLKGERQSQAKLTEDQVCEIREKWEGGRSQASIGREYRVTGPTIRAVVYRQTWKHVA